MLGKNVHVKRNKEIWRLQLRCNAWADVNDINRRTEPKTVAFESLYGKLPKSCVGSLSFFQHVVVFLPLSIPSYRMLGFDTSPFFPSSAVPGSNGRKQGLAGGLGSRMDGTTVVSVVAMKSASGPYKNSTRHMHSHNSYIPANMFRALEKCCPRFHQAAVFLCVCFL